jgi:hypothetical protein
MEMWTQRIRGAIGIGVTWAAGWVVVGALTGLAISIGLNFPLARVVWNYATAFAILGFFGGAIFSLLLSYAERKRNFEQLSLPRFAVWGALGGLVLGVSAVAISLFGLPIASASAIAGGAAALLGAGSAAGTLAIARGPRRNALPEAETVPRELIGEC